MKRIFLPTLILILIHYISFGSTGPEKEEVEKVILTLFDGMRLGDSSMVHNVFDQEVVLFSLGEKEGKAILKKGDLQRFLDAIGTPHEEIWDEKIWGTRVEIDGPLATVWTNYSFYVGEKFSHCEIDVFQLIRREDGWKIFQLSDTRRTGNCNDN